MSHAIIKGANGRRHEVNFGNGPVEVSVHVTDLVVEIVVEAPDDDCRPGARRFSLLNLPRHQFANAFKEITYRRADAGGSKTLRTVGDDA
jgi:hypothetical protein